MTSSYADILERIQAALDAAREVFARFTPGAVATEYKAGHDPVTEADRAVDAVLRQNLLRDGEGWLSEETADSPDRLDKQRVWIVDPLDGTREFVAGRDEYTVNIALMQGGAPILGIIAAPAFGLIWRGIVGSGAERIAFTEGRCSPPRAIHARQNPDGRLVILASRSHLEARTRAFLDRFPQAELMQCGSSIKFCRLAEGAADLYPRLAPTHDWDIAAGHGILKAAGGEVRAPDGSPVVYGSTELLVPAFIASAGPFRA